MADDRTALREALEAIEQRTRDKVPPEWAIVIIRGLALRALAATQAPEAPTGHTADVLRELLSRAVADMKLAIRAEFPSSRLIHRR